MERTLKYLAIRALIRPFWVSDDYSDELDDDSVVLQRCWLPQAVKFASKIRSLDLPATLEDEVMQAILECGKRKSEKLFINMLMDVTLREPNPDPYLDRDGNPIEELPMVANIESRAPELRAHFPHDDDHVAAVDLAIILRLPNPHDDPTLLRQLLTKPDFLRNQTKFIEHFSDVWHGTFYDGLFGQFHILAQEFGWLGLHSAFALLHCLECTVSETLPWFVFELLDDEQRDKFLALGHNTELMECDDFRTLFASLFKHWPWQNEAFDRYFGGRDKFSKPEREMLVEIGLYHLVQEQEAIKAGMVPRQAWFSKKVEKFLLDKHINENRDENK